MTWDAHWLILFGDEARKARHRGSSFSTASSTTSQGPRSEAIPDPPWPRARWEGHQLGKPNLIDWCRRCGKLAFFVAGQPWVTLGNCCELLHGPLRWDLRENPALSFTIFEGEPSEAAEWGYWKVIITQGCRFSWGDESWPSFFGRGIDGFMNDASFAKSLYYELIKRVKNTLYGLNLIRKLCKMLYFTKLFQIISFWPVFPSKASPPIWPKHT